MSIGVSCPHATITLSPPPVPDDPMRENGSEWSLSGRRPAWVSWGLKLAVAVVFLGVIWSGYSVSLSGLSVLANHGILLALAVLLRLAFTGVQALRLHALARASLPKISRRALLRATYVGQLCNQILPGSVGGDVIRGALIWRQRRTAWQGIVALLLLDRMAGLLSLTVIALVLCPAALLTDSVGIKALGVGAAAVLLAIAWVGRHRLVAWTARFPVLQSALALPASLGRGQLVRAGTFAVAGHGLFLLSGAVIFSAAEVPLSWPVRLGVLALSSYVGNLPLSLGGHGIREGSLILLLSDPFHWWSAQPLARPEQAFVVAAAIWIIHIGTSALGGLVALGIPTPKPAPSP